MRAMSEFRQVPRRRFGRTGLQMPVFSTGGMRYQQGWNDLPPEEIEAASTEHVASCIERSLQHGINHIETARGYGTSEWQLGEVLPTYRREDLIVQTKIGINENLEGFKASFQKSWDLLRQPYIDLLAIHGINQESDLEKAFDYALPQMLQWKREGKIRSIGFSTHGPADVITKACWSGYFDYVNLHWYFINDINWPAVQAAAAQDMGVFIISPSDKGGRLWDPTEKLKALCAPLTPMQFNDLYCLSRSAVHTLSLGASKPSDYQEHVDAMQWWDDRTVISSTIADRLRAEIDAEFGSGWSQGFLAGIPDARFLPGEVNVRELLRLYTFAKTFDMIPFAKDRYNLFQEPSPWFFGRDASNVDEPKLYEALAFCPHRDQVMALLPKAHELLHDQPVQRLSVSEKKKDEDQ